MDIHRIVQIALLGQVPPTLRCVYSNLTDNVFEFNALFIENTPQEHVAAIDEALTEISSHFSSSVKVVHSFQFSNTAPWKIGDGSNLVYLRFGELSDT
ncbi:hypothetical protein [Parashewanella tropica]|uniref:hypothetical protein n=1 Tax=Parashewanella tropica TaxID=2547970 RepID=UPI001059BE5F|nr:hypothetical protein [Parashewanella tropica]